MTERNRLEHDYSLALLIMTASTGAIDCVSYLTLDRGFTGSMTGSVQFLGFGLAGVQGVPLVNNLVALLTFMLGAAVVSRITRRGVGEVKLPTSSIAVLVVGTMLTLALSALWIAVGALGGPAMIIITGVLALVLGAQAAAVKHVGIRDLSTVVVTMTMVNLSTDSRLAGGNGVSVATLYGTLSPD